MKNRFRKGDLIVLVDENGNNTNGSMWMDKDRELEKGDIFELTTTNNFPPIKIEVVSNQSFPLIAREL